MTTTCGACGAGNQDGAFCTVCGTPTGRPSRPAVAAVAPPEPAGPPLAGVGRRAAAYVLDVLAVSLLAGVVAALTAVATGLPDALAEAAEATGTAAASDAFGALVVVYSVIAVVSLLAWLGLALADGLAGWTVGNALLGIRTRGLDGGALGAGRGILRWLVLGLCGVLPLVGTVLVLVSPTFDSSGRRQGWHDKAARSVVHDVRGAASAGDGPPGAAAPGAEPAPELPDPWAFPQEQQRQEGGLITGVPGDPGTAPVRTSEPSPRKDFSGPPTMLREGTGPLVPPAQDAAAGTGPIAQGTGPIAPSAQDTAASTGPLVPPVQRPAPADPPAADDPEDLEATRISAPLPPVSAERPGPAWLALETGPGRRVTVSGRVLLGRNPQQDDGPPAALVRVDDATRSVSKTHLEVVPAAGTLRVRDLGSTNGSAVTGPDGTARALVPGQPAEVGPGWTVQAGGSRFRVLGPDAGA